MSSYLLQLLFAQGGGRAPQSEVLLLPLEFLEGKLKKWVITIGATSSLFLGCAGKQETVQTPDDPRVYRSTAIVLESCAQEGAGVEALDANADGRPDVWRSSKDGREVCRIVDLNLDGRPDRTTFFDAQGKVRRVESDYDRDGRVDEIALYEAGRLVEKHRATTLGGKLDTWEFYEEEKLVRTERDENGDGVIDQWWEYAHPECPVIHTDVDGDGRPDPSATIDYCQATGYVPPPVSQEDGGPQGPDFVIPDGVVRESVREVSTVTEEESDTEQGEGN